MTSNSGLEQLRDDIMRWRRRLPVAESTYCQGIANKASKQFEGLLKGLAEDRLTGVGSELPALLKRIKYQGGAQSIGKLSLGTATQLVLQLREDDEELEAACTERVRESLTSIPAVRNEATHEAPPEEMRAMTSRLLDLIEQVLDEGAFASLMEAARRPSRDGPD